MRAVMCSTATGAGSISYPIPAYMFNVQKCMYFKWGGGEPYTSMFEYTIFPTEVGKMQFGPTYSGHSNPSDGQVIGALTH